MTRLTNRLLGHGVARAIRLLVIGYIILGLGVAGAFYRAEDLRHERIRQLNTINAAQCHALDDIYRAIRASITTSDLRLDGTAYYKQHPDELAAAHATNLAELRRFEAPACTVSSRVTS